MNDFSLTIDDVEYQVSQITCVTPHCDRFQYIVTARGERCTVVASLDGNTCMSGCLDPELRHAACNQLKAEIRQQIRSNHVLYKSHL